MKFLKTFLLLTFFCCYSFLSFGQDNFDKNTKFWKDIPKEKMELKADARHKLPKAYRAVEFDLTALRPILLKADKISSNDLLDRSKRESLIKELPTIVLPTPDGKSIEFKITDSGLLTKESKEKHNYKFLAIRGFDVERTGISITISFSHLGINIMVLGTGDNIEKYNIKDFNFNHKVDKMCPAVVYYAKDENYQWNKQSYK